MAFEARDLMIDVLPKHDEFYMGCGVISPDAPAPPPPQPCPDPSCVNNSAPAAEPYDERGQLAPLAVLREQLHQALHP
jgi:hypothetical protein